MRGRLPWQAIGLATLTLAFLVVPFAALLARAAWSDLGADVAGADSALVLSLVVSLTAAALSLLGGIPLAWALARGRFRGKALVRGAVLLPLVVPPVVGGVALLAAFGRSGWMGQWLDAWLGLVLPFSLPGAVIAATFVALPFVVITAEAGFAAVDHRLEEQARSLGAGPARVFARVTLPLSRSAVAAGAVLAWARALGEFGATITFAGNLPGRTQTLPLAIFLRLETDPQQAIALSLVIVVVSLAVLMAARRAWRRP